MSADPASQPAVFHRDDLKRINLNAAGIDVWSREMYVAVPADRSVTPVRSFGTFTGDVHRLAQWHIDSGITSAVMESTGVYWIPLWEVLESYGIDVILVDARRVKNVSGRKADVSDSQWLQTLHTYGLLVEARAEHVQHMRKALVLLNVQVTQVVTDITGVTGMRTMRAIIAGERDLTKIAGMRDQRVKASTDSLRHSSVTGAQSTSSRSGRPSSSTMCMTTRSSANAKTRSRRSWSGSNGAHSK